MRIAPESFVKELERNFFGRMRIRWSNRKNEWQIEEQVHRGTYPPTYVSENDDNLLRVRDGYALVCSIKPGDRTPCPKCKTELRVPIREFGEIRCPFCTHRGRGHSEIAGYFDLNDTLIQHLRRISGLYPWRETIIGDIRIHEEKKIASEERDLDTLGEAVMSEGYNRMNQNPQTGYTAKTDAMRVKET